MRSSKIPEDDTALRTWLMDGHILIQRCFVAPQNGSWKKDVYVWMTSFKALTCWKPSRLTFLVAPLSLVLSVDCFAFLLASFPSAFVFPFPSFVSLWRIGDRCVLYSNRGDFHALPVAILSLSRRCELTELVLKLTRKVDFSKPM